MLIIKTWCLPKLEEGELQKLHRGLVAAAVAVTEFNVHDENDMVNLFPKDMMSYGLGSEIVVEVAEVGPWLSHSLKVYHELLHGLAETVSQMFPRAKVHVLINENKIKAFVTRPPSKQ